MIEYINDLNRITVDYLDGFFIGWPNPPSKFKHYELLKNSTYVWIAVDKDRNQVVGFINALSDQVLSAYIPLLEVLPEYQGKGIGGHLVELMIDTLKDYYMVDLMCDDNMQSFYQRFNMFKAGGMITRNYDMQGGKVK